MLGMKNDAMNNSVREAKRNGCVVAAGRLPFEEVHTTALLMVQVGSVSHLRCSVLICVAQIKAACKTRSTPLLVAGSGTLTFIELDVDGSELGFADARTMTCRFNIGPNTSSKPSGPPAHN
jgi:hypothetical protein